MNEKNNTKYTILIEQSTKKISCIQKILNKVNECDHFVFICYNILIVVIHIFLLSIFEPYFYFYYITKIEKQAFQKKMSEYLHKMGGFYVNDINSDFRFYIKNILNSTINNIYQNVINEYNNYEITRQKEEETLHHKCMIYGGIILSILITFLCCSCMIRKKISWKSIVLENFVMIACLAGYEYIFFNNVVLGFTPMSLSRN